MRDNQVWHMILLREMRKTDKLEHLFLILDSRMELDNFLEKILTFEQSFVKFKIVNVKNRT